MIRFTDVVPDPKAKKAKPVTPVVEPPAASDTPKPAKAPRKSKKPA